MQEVNQRAKKNIKETKRKAQTEAKPKQTSTNKQLAL